MKKNTYVFEYRRDLKSGKMGEPISSKDIEKESLFDYLNDFLSIHTNILQGVIYKWTDKGLTEVFDYDTKGKHKAYVKETRQFVYLDKTNKDAFYKVLNQIESENGL